MVSAQSYRFRLLEISPSPRDLSSATGMDPLVSVGSISAHTRPVEALAGEVVSRDSAILYSADTMGLLKIWLLERDKTTDDVPPRWRTTLRENLTHHRTRINQMVLHNGYIWTGKLLLVEARSYRGPLIVFAASADDTVKIHPHSFEGGGSEKRRPVKPIQHPTGVRGLLPLYIPELDETYLFTASGDIIRSWDTSDLEDRVEQRNEIDGHWHDVTLLKVWSTPSDLYILSASLDGTIRRWKVKGGEEGFHSIGDPLTNNFRPINPKAAGGEKRPASSAPANSRRVDRGGGTRIRRTLER